MYVECIQISDTIFFAFTYLLVLICTFCTKTFLKLSLCQKSSQPFSQLVISGGKRIVLHAWLYLTNLFLPIVGLPHLMRDGELPLEGQLLYLNGKPNKTIEGTYGASVCTFYTLVWAPEKSQSSCSCSLVRWISLGLWDCWNEEPGCRAMWGQRWAALPGPNQQLAINRESTGNELHSVLNSLPSLPSLLAYSKSHWSCMLVPSAGGQAALQPNQFHIESSLSLGIICHHFSKSCAPLGQRPKPTSSLNLHCH